MMSKLPPITKRSKNNHCEKKRCRLLELPYEIRASILHLSLQPSSRSIYVGRRERWNLIEGRKVLLGSCPSILTTCRQVYRECLNVLQDKHATFVLHLRKGMHSLPSNLSYRKHVRRLTLAILAKSNRKSRLEIYLPMTLERLTLQMEKTFPNLQHLSLTLCVRSPMSPPEFQSSPACGLPVLVLHTYWRPKISRVSFQLIRDYTSEVCRIARECPRTALNDKLGWVNGLPNLTWLDFYCDTELSDRPHNESVAVQHASTGQLAPMHDTSTRIASLLRREKTSMRPLIDALPDLFPQVQSIQFYRKLTWRLSLVSYEILDINEAEETAVPRLTRRRTIGLTDDQLPFAPEA